MLNTTNIWLSGLLLAAAASANVETCPADMGTVTVTVNAGTVTVTATAGGLESHLPLPLQGHTVQYTNGTGTTAPTVHVPTGPFPTGISTGTSTPSVVAPRPFGAPMIPGSKSYMNGLSSSNGQSSGKKEASSKGHSSSSGSGSGHEHSSGSGGNGGSSGHGESNGGSSGHGSSGHGGTSGNGTYHHHSVSPSHSPSLANTQSGLPTSGTGSPTSVVLPSGTTHSNGLYPSSEMGHFPSATGSPLSITASGTAYSHYSYPSSGTRSPASSGGYYPSGSALPSGSVILSGVFPSGTYSGTGSNIIYQTATGSSQTGPSETNYHGTSHHHTKHHHTRHHHHQTESQTGVSSIVPSATQSSIAPEPTFYLEITRSLDKRVVISPQQYIAVVPEGPGADVDVLEITDDFAAVADFTLSPEGYLKTVDGSLAPLEIAGLYPGESLIELYPSDSTVPDTKAVCTLGPAGDFTCEANGVTGFYACSDNDLRPGLFEITEHNNDCYTVQLGYVLSDGNEPTITPSSTNSGIFPTGTGNYPSGTGSPPSGPGRYPSGTGNYPSGTGYYPSGSGSPSGSGYFPSGTGPKYPTGTGNPSVSGSLSGSGYFPSGTGPKYPTGTGNPSVSGSPSGSGYFPSGTGPKYPTGTPSESGYFPSGTGSPSGYPSRSGYLPSGYPSSTGTGSIPSRTPINPSGSGYFPPSNGPTGGSSSYGTGMYPSGTGSPTSYGTGKPIYPGTTAMTSALYPTSTGGGCEPNIFGGCGPITQIPSALLETYPTGYGPYHWDKSGHVESKGAAASVPLFALIVGSILSVLLLV